MSIFSSIRSFAMPVFAAPRARISARLRVASRIAGVTLALGIATPSVHAGYDAYIGELTLVGFTFCPNGTVNADGRLLSISQNSALFSLLGTQFGGDGINNFALPDLRSRVPVGAGQGAGLSNIQIGQMAGTENVTILQANMPAHQHATTIAVSNQPATHATPANGMALGQSMNAGTYVQAAPNTTLASGVSGISGGSQAVGIRNPYVGMLWCITTSGIYPPRP